MTVDPFHVDLDGVLEKSRLHAGIAAALDQSMGTATAAGVDDVHGSIGAGATGAFREVLDARREALKAASNTSAELSDRLGRAVFAYARGDESGAASVRAAAAALEDGASGSSGTPIVSGAPHTSGTVGAAESSGADALGQGAGQLGQQAGQPMQASGVGASAAVSDDLAADDPAVAPLQAPSRPAADERAERLTRD